MSSFTGSKHWSVRVKYLQLSFKWLSKKTTFWEDKEHTKMAKMFESELYKKTAYNEIQKVKEEIDIKKKWVWNQINAQEYICLKGSLMLEAILA